jgi:hypothetical protein
LATKKATSKQPAQKKDAAAFMDHFQKNKKLKGKIRDGWNAVIADAKKQGYKFTRQELRDHIKKRYGLKSPPGSDEPDTCVCI